MKKLFYVLLCGLLLFPANLSAQIIADPTAPGNQQPQVLSTQGGVPQVNISTPNQRGMSYNRYQQFDVGQPGAILNNSGSNVQTQLGGWIEGNPNILGNAANLIVNEVVSSRPSQLMGFVEVAGKRAEVVIANPSGINVNGFGFINASRGTLTTGKPQINNGQLTGYLVNSGQINITGDGMNGRNSNYTDIIAQSVALNAGIWAEKNLNVITGSNQVTRQGDGYDVQALDPHAGAITGVALDVSALGGMYAGHIYLVGTDKGLGVRNAGEIMAYAGEVVVTSDGRIENIRNISNNSDGVISGRDGVKIQAEDIRNSGRIQSEKKDVVLTSGKDIKNKGEILAQGTVSVTAKETFRNTGLVDGNETVVWARLIENVNTGVLAGNRVALEAEDILNGLDWLLSGQGTSGVIWARNRLDIGVSGTLTNREDGLIYSGGDAFIGLSLNSALEAIGQGGTVLNASAFIDVAGSLYGNVTSFHNENHHYKTERREIYRQRHENTFCVLCVFAVRI